MKRTVIALFASAFLFAMSAFAVQAQNPGHPEGTEGHKHMGHGMPSAEEHLKMLTEKLSLTPDQQAKVKTILVDHHQQMESFMKDESGSKEDRMKKRKAMHDDLRAKLNGVLNDDQKKKFAEMQKDMHDHDHMGQGHMGEKHNHDKGDDHPHN